MALTQESILRTPKPFLSHGFRWTSHSPFTLLHPRPARNIRTTVTVARSTPGSSNDNWHRAGMKRHKEMAALLARRARDGLSLRAQSEELGIPIGTLASWIWQLRHGDHG